MARDILDGLLAAYLPHPQSLLATVCMTHLTQSGFHNTTVSSEKEFSAVLADDPLLAYASQSWFIHASVALDVEQVKRQLIRFVDSANAFPAFIDFHWTSSFDISLLSIWWASTNFP
jgi:hypothetical protein